MNPEFLNTIFYLSPILILVISALFVLLLAAFLPMGQKLLLAISFGGIGASALVCIELWNLDSFSLFNEAIRIDKFSIFFTLLSLALTALTFLISYSFVQQKRIPFGEYAFFLLSCCAGMSLMAWASDLLTLFMSLEIMSLSAYILTGIERERHGSSEGALKYFLLGAFSTGFLLYGIASLYAVSGSTQFSSISHFLITSKYTVPPMFYIGMGLLIVGMGFKIGVVPFHMWVPDVYEGAPTPITGYMATGIKAASFAAFLRFFLIALFSIKTDWATIILGLSIVTMTVGNIAALIQTNIKRMLAYSSIAHAGYILVGVVSATEGGAFDLAMSSILFYLIAYGAMTLGAFGILVLGSSKEDKNNIQDYHGFGFKHPYLGLAMTIFMLSLIGVPPLAGFMAKFYIFSSALKAQFFTLAIIGIINSIIASYYYLRVIVALYMKTHEHSTIISAALPSTSLNIALACLALATVGLGILPSSVFEIVLKTISSLL